MKEIRIMTQKVMSTDFETEVLKSNKPVLVDFYADWCGPCKALAPVLEEVSGERADALKIVKLNVEESMDVAEKYAVRAMPTLLLFRDGQVIGITRGAQSKSKLMAWIDETLAKPADAVIDMAAAAVETDKKSEQMAGKITTLAIQGGAIFGLVVGATMTAGAIALAISGAGAVAALGAAAAVVNASRLFLGVHLFQQARKISQAVLVQHKGGAKFDAKEFAMPASAILKNPVVQGAMGVVNLGAGIALFSVGGFATFIPATLMAVSGGWGTVAATVRAARAAGVLAAQRDVEQMTRDLQKKAIAPENNPAPELKSKLDGASAQPDFKAAANSNEAPAAEKQTPAAAPKPPKVG